MNPSFFITVAGPFLHELANAGSPPQPIIQQPILSGARFTQADGPQFTTAQPASLNPRHTAKLTY